MNDKIEIENVPVGVPHRGRPAKTGYRLQTSDLVRLLKSLDIGQSFVVDKFDGNHSTVMSICSAWSERGFRSAKQADGTYRIGRVK